MTILVTGAAGFIGSHLCEYLIQLNYNVIGIDNFDPFYPRAIKQENIKGLLVHPDFQFFQIDIENKNQLDSISDKPIDAVIHLAAKAGVLPSLKDPKKYFETNIDGTYNILEWMKQRNINKLLFASSSSVYGNNKKIPFSEDDNVDHPISPYAFSKKSCELLNYTYHHLYKINVINLRFFTVYGPRQRPDLAIHKFIWMIDQDRTLTLYGDGSTARDYTYVSDTISGICQALEYIFKNQSVYDTFNLGNNKPVKLIDLVRTIYTVIGKEPNIVFLPMQPGDVDITYASLTKAEQAFDYKPKVGIVEGITAFYNWFLLQKQIPVSLS